jgi:RNA polymerase sigma factor (sigma-70 family)
MGKQIKFRPDYASLYPGVKISAEVLEVLKTSDYRMEYEEYHLKTERTLKDKNGAIVRDEYGEPIKLPAREDSLDRLLETHRQFADHSADLERNVMRSETHKELHRCVDLLPEREREVINALYFDGLSETDCALKMGVSQPMVFKIKTRVLKKIKKILSKGL